MTDRLIDRVCEEIINDAITLLKSHSLIKAKGKDYVRGNRIRLILSPVAQRLLTTLGKDKLEKQFKTLLQDYEISIHDNLAM